MQLLFPVRERSHLRDGNDEGGKAAKEMTMTVVMVGLIPRLGQ